MARRSRRSSMVARLSVASASVANRLRGTSVASLRRTSIRRRLTPPFAATAVHIPPVGIPPPLAEGRLVTADGAPATAAAAAPGCAPAAAPDAAVPAALQRARQQKSLLQQAVPMLRLPVRAPSR
eukprot:2726669-Prymnesium_polylepis.1